MCESFGCGPSPVPAEGFGLIYAGPHVHVGGISLELVNADTGEQICYGQAEYGSGDDALDEEG